MCKIAYKILTIVTILVALALAVAATVWHEQGLNYILFVSRFFDVILPVLAVGALLKYLFGCHHHPHGTCYDKEQDTCVCNKEDCKCNNDKGCACDAEEEVIVKKAAPAKKKAVVRAKKKS